MRIKLADRLKQIDIQKVLQSLTPMSTMVHGHVLDVLKVMPDSCVHAVVTSPPYWGLRDYNTTLQVWGGQGGCNHKWADSSIARKSGGNNEWSRKRFMRKVGETSIETPQGRVCQKCEAWEGSLGLEPTSEMYIQHLVTVFRDVRRVLRDDGICWLNIDDTYVGGVVGRTDASRKYQKLAHSDSKKRIGDGSISVGNLSLIPSRLLIALQNDGWCVRDIVIWVKMWQDHEGKSDGTVMPGGTGTGRMTSAWEYVFQLTKSRKYYFDLHAEKTTTRSMYRNVLRVNIQPTSGSHIAPFPENLVSPLIKMSTSGAGCCPECRRCYVREDSFSYTSGWMPNCECFGKIENIKVMKSVKDGEERRFVKKRKQRYIWNNKKPVLFPSIILDPFAGSGTVGQVALRQRKSFIGIDLNPVSIKEAEERIGNRWTGKHGRHDI